MKNFSKYIGDKANVQKYGILLGALLLVSPNIMAEKSLEYSSDTNFREPLSKYDGNIDNHAKPSIYDKRLKQNKISDSPILKQLNSLHPDARWMLLIDGRWHEYGPSIFDKDLRNIEVEEPGYLIATNTAFKHVFNPIHMQKKLDADYYLELHKILVKNVNIRSKNKHAMDYRAGHKTCFGLNGGYLNGYMAKESSSWASDREIYSPDALNQRNIFRAIKLEIGEARQKVNVIFKEYYSKLDEIEKNGFAEGSLLSHDASTEDKKLEVIARICQNLDQLHAFCDGNVRTINLVLQRMLVENNLKPAVLDDPNCLDMSHTQIIINAIKAGQKKYDEVLKISKMLYDKNVPTNYDCNRNYNEILNSKDKNSGYTDYMKAREEIFCKYIRDNPSFRAIQNILPEFPGFEIFV